MGGVALPLPAPGEDQKDQAEDARDVNAAMQRLLQQPEAGRVVVEAREAEQQDRDDPSGRGQQRPESHFRIEFGLELLDLGVVEFCPSSCGRRPPSRGPLTALFRSRAQARGYFIRPISL